MIPVTTFAGKKVAVFGLGSSGLLSARALAAGGAEVIAFDDDGKKLAEAQAAGFKTQDLHEIDWRTIAALVLAWQTPGVAEGQEQPAAKKKAPAKRKSRAKVAKEVRLKAFWGVFNQSLRRVTVFEYSQRAEADKKAAELSESGKSPHFVQLVKEVIEE